ncbi:hypothetical protein NHX12_027428 [Muraenolepis orangiensis]|uniref:Uncharacterized protein n=1 Tax=Muraenolepis orangiensis TaxID=630683 RepID=A0A9Q0IQE8_9TELE|nr:hypothetical protein NHX12_027428 [Muraenolepis orangiensis]
MELAIQRVSPTTVRAWGSRPTSFTVIIRIWSPTWWEKEGTTTGEETGTTTGEETGTTTGEETGTTKGEETGTTTGEETGTTTGEETGTTTGEETGTTTGEETGMTTGEETGTTTGEETGTTTGEETGTTTGEETGTTTDVSMEGEEEEEEEEEREEVEEEREEVEEEREEEEEEREEGRLRGSHGRGPTILSQCSSILPPNTPPVSSTSLPSTAPREEGRFPWRPEHEHLPQHQAHVGVRKAPVDVCVCRMGTSLCGFTQMSEGKTAGMARPRPGGGCLCVTLCSCLLVISPQRTVGPWAKRSRVYSHRSPSTLCEILKGKQNPTKTQ